MVITTADIAEAAAAVIDQEVTGPAGPFFRRVFNLRFDTGGTPDGIAVDADTLAFDASFSAQTYNLLSAESPIQAAATEALDAQTVVVRLDRPWRIKRVSRKASYGGDYAVAFGHARHRWTCAAAPGHLAVESGHHAGHVGEIAWHLGVRFQLFRMDGEAVAEEPTVTVASGAHLHEDFISQAFALRARNEVGALIDLDLGDIAALEIETFPTGPRIGLSTLEEVDSTDTPPVYFWQVPGEVYDTALYEAPNEKAASAMAGALQRLLDEQVAQWAGDAQASGLPYSVPDHLELALVVDSDAPCQAQIDIQIAYHLVRKHIYLPDSSGSTAKKQVLRFEGQPSASDAVHVSLPADAVVSSAVLEVDASFGCPPATPAGEGVNPIPAGSNAGVHVTMDRWAAQSLILTEALTLTEIAIGIMALETPTDLSVVLRADNNGAPDGQVLADQQVRLAAPGVRLYARVALDDSLALAAPNYWLLVRALSGSAIWLTRSTPQSRILSALATPSGGIATTRQPLDDVQGYFALFTRRLANCPDTVPLMLNVGGGTIALSQAENGRFLADGESLTDSLNDCLAAPTDDCIPTSEGLVVPLTFTAVSKGMVTVYVPILHYDMVVS